MKKIFRKVKTDKYRIYYIFGLKILIKRGLFKSKKKITKELYFSNKNLEFKKDDKILILSPHPDDESIACGGLLLKYAQQCDVVVLTDGRYGNPEWTPEETKKIRLEELQTAMEYANVKSFKCLNIEDSKLRDGFEIFKKINLYAYDYILCPNSEETHQDHKALYDFVAMSNTNATIIFYEVWSAISKPNKFIDISDIAENKKALINFYKSQIKHIDYASYILALNNYRCIQYYPENKSTTKYVEAYKITNK